MTRIDDPAAVREQYATEAGLAARRSIDTDLAGVDDWDFSFRAENGAELLGQHFRSVEVRDASGTVTLHDADQIRGYLRSSIRLHRWADRVPELGEPLVVRRRPVVFVAKKP